MNIQYYFNYITIVEEGSLTAAARKLHIAQPALSNQIKALEQSYGARLFYRGARNLELTDAGLILYKKAKWMCEVEVAAKNEIRSVGHASKGILRIGLSSSASNTITDKTLERFAELYPDTHVKIIEDEPSELIKRLQNGEVEVLQLRTDEGEVLPDNLEIIYEGKERMGVAFDPKAGFLPDSKGESISVLQLNELPLSIIEKMQPLAEDYFGKLQNATLNIKCISTRLQLALMWAQEGTAVAVTPKVALSDLGFDDLSFRYLSEEDVPQTVCYLIAQKQRYRSLAANNYMMLLSQVRNLGIEEKLQNRLEIPKYYK